MTIIRVLGEDWVVKVESIIGTDGTRAYCDGDAREIVLDPHRSGQSDLLHELIHSLEFALGFELFEAISPSSSSTLRCQQV